MQICVSQWPTTISEERVLLFFRMLKVSRRLRNAKCIYQLVPSFEAGNLYKPTLVGDFNYPH